MKIFGIRKSRIRDILNDNTWVEATVAIKKIIETLDDERITALVTSSTIDTGPYRVYTNREVAKRLTADSEYHKYYTQILPKTKIAGNIVPLVELSALYGKVVKIDEIRVKINDSKESMDKRYPLLQYISNIPVNLIADYIKTVDKQEKTNE